MEITRKLTGPEMARVVRASGPGALALVEAAFSKARETGSCGHAASRPGSMKCRMIVLAAAQGDKLEFPWAGVGGFSRTINGVEA